VSALKEKIVSLIRAQGPITIAQYMQIALGDPFHGYYIARDPFGRDFVTAPEVSQIFGELVGLFFVQAWEDRGRPDSFHLVELGPGRGTLMADMLRAAGTVRPGFVRAAKIVLLETSPMLRSIQKKTLEPHAPAWALRLAEIADDKPVYLVANEFFDALPIRQFVLSEKGWHERMIATEGDNLVFALTPDPQPVGFDARGGAIGAVRETNHNAEAMTVEIGTKITETNGVGLVIDYGYSTRGFGDTFQAVKENAYADPLESPGEADLTAHVDFAALKNAAAAGGADVAGPIPQGDLLRRLGIGVRADRLKSATPEKSSEIDSAVERLTGEKEMGSLFKAMAFSARGSVALPGF
jgi:SAM-dependent MidA family methyltransferase